MKEKKEQFTHLDASMRRAIEAGLNANEPFSLIARKIGVATSTVSREVRRNRRSDGPSRKVDRDKNDCAMLKTCKQKHLCGAKDCGRLCRCCLKPCKRANVYFADPSRPDQKGGCEKNHVELRKILPKGTSFEGLDAATLTEICCHVNSSVRKGCGDVSPMQLAQLVFPRELMDNLGLELIPPRDVVSAPGILYQRLD